jgi:signal transduction histidine kinase
MTPSDITSSGMNQSGMVLHSLSARITVLIATAIVVLLGIGALLIDLRVDSELQDRFTHSLGTQARALAAMVEVEKGELVSDAAWQPASLLGGESEILYEVRCGGQVLATSDDRPAHYPPGWPDQVATTPTFAVVGKRSPGFETVTLAFRSVLGESWGPDMEAREHAWLLTKPQLADRECRLLLMQDRGELHETLIALDWILALVPILALLLAVVLVPLLVRRGMTPLTALGERMRDIGPQRPGQRVEPTGLRELDPLIDRVNEVLTRMDEGIARERQFASGLAHETRTRLAELRLLVDVETRYPRGRPVEDILREVGTIGGELEATVTALLTLTRIEAGIEQPSRQDVELDAWLRRQLSGYDAVVRDRSLTVDIHGFDAYETIASDPALLDIAFGNLIANALAYAPAGGTVGIARGNGTLSVSNAAPDLTEADLGNMGDRFWRKHTESPGHAGLGLALAGAAARVLGMRLEFRLVDGVLTASLLRA